MLALQPQTNRRLAHLREMELFSKCSRAELGRVGSLTTTIDVHQGKVLAEEGSPGLEFFVIVDGTATAFRHGLRLAGFGPGSFFGELALLDSGYRTATVVADTEMTLLVLSRAEFHSILVSAPSVACSMLIEMGVRLRQTDVLLDDVSSGASGPAVAAGAAPC